MVGAGHHVRQKTEHPIIGILTQPVHPGLWTEAFETVQALEYEKRPKDDDAEIFERKQYIDASHVKFLEAAGARVVPVDFTLDKNELPEVLSQLNGLYIPGDSARLVTPH